MDTNLVLWFRAVYEAGTIAKAAEILHMTPGALSRAMKRLEAELEIELFINSGRNILPTKEGHQFYGSSYQILKSIENAKRSLKEDHALNEIKISTFEVFSSHFMSWMLAREKFDQEIIVKESIPGEIEKDILSDKSQFGLTYMPSLHPELDHLVIGKMELGIFQSAEASREELPFAVPTTEIDISSFQTHSLDGWPLNKSRHIQYKFQMLETALDLASRGCARIVCPKFLIKIENERLSHKFKLIEVESKVKLPTFNVYAVKKKNISEDKTFKRICKSIRVALS